MALFLKNAVFESPRRCARRRRRSLSPVPWSSLEFRGSVQISVDKDPANSTTPWIALLVDCDTGAKAHNVLVEEWQPHLLAVVGNDSIITTEVSRRQTVQVHCQLVHECRPSTFVEFGAMPGCPKEKE
jgi:hypothetical protein